MNSPEAPFVAGGALIAVASVARTGGIPKNLLPALMAIVALAIIASVTTGTKAGKVVRAIGFLFLLTAGMAAVVALNDAADKRKKTTKKVK